MLSPIEIKLVSNRKLYTVLKRSHPPSLLFSCSERFVLEKANTQSGELSADLAKKNKLVDKIAELQRETGEVRLKMLPEGSVRHDR